MESVLVRVLYGGTWHYWQECWGLDTVLAAVASAEQKGYRVWVSWPRDCGYLVGE